MKKIDYTIIKSKRKTIAIQIDRNLNVIVRAPYYAKKSDIESFVASNTEWIEKVMPDYKERRKWLKVNGMKYMNMIS